MNAFYWILFILCVTFAFWGGIVIGITDCKRKFMIPKGCESLYEYECHLIEEYEEMKAREAEYGSNNS